MDQREYDSNEEMYFEWWLAELKDNNIVNHYTRDTTIYVLSDNVTIQQEEVLKTKTKIVEIELLPKITYRPDFAVAWNMEHEHIDLFINNLYLNTKIKNKYSTIYVADHISAIDVKSSIPPKFSTSYSTLYTFPIKQKWMVDKFKIYVSKVPIPKLFEKTFTPARFLLTNKTSKERVINFDTRTLNDYINLCQK